MSHRQHIHQLTGRILDAGNHDYGVLLKAAEELYSVLMEVTGTQEEAENNREHLRLETGTAIGLTWAAMCIRDFMRTKRFMQGVYQATKDQLDKNKDKPVHLLYAGTGPFATLILPLLGRFTPAQVQFSLLEVNETSYACLEKLVKALQLQESIATMECTDATSFTLPPGAPVNIFISETMQQALKKEPQVAIFRNIIPQLPTDAVVIPEQVRLQAALINPTARFRFKTGEQQADTGLHLLENIFILNREFVTNHLMKKNAQAELPGWFSLKTITIPAALSSLYPELAIATEIIVYPGICLALDESPLTIPLHLADLQTGRFKVVHFSYNMGRVPGIEFRLE